MDTNQYARNFERQMGAYLTGRVWKYFPGISKVLAALYKQETGDLCATLFISILGRHESDGKRWPNYTDSWDTPGWLKESRANHLSAEDRIEYRKRADERLYKCPAGMSVAIAFTERPTSEQIKLLEKRAKGFPKAVRKAMKEAKTLPWHIRSGRNIYFTGPIPRITGTRLLRRDGDRYVEVAY
ncbi:MAG: hypothetical protein Q7S32_04215 [bacterium]|nr:hypothetical protein [bacterium]